MNMSKSRSIWSIIINVIIIGCITFGIGTCVFGWIGGGTLTPFFLNGFADYSKWYQTFFRLYIDANIMLGVSSIFMIIADIISLARGNDTPKWISIFKLMAVTTAIVATVLSCIVYTAKTGISFDFAKLCDWHNTLWLFVVAPALGLLSYIFIDLAPQLKTKYFVWSLLPFATYIVAMTLYVCLKKVDATTIKSIYWFIVDYNASTWYLNLAWIGGSLVGAGLISFIVLFFHNLLSKAFVKAHEPTSVTPVESTPVEEVAPVQQVAPAQDNNAPKKTGKKVIILKTQADKEAEASIPVEEDSGDEDAEVAQEEKEEAAAKAANPNYRGVARVYHISKQPTGKWQVKLATGERAIKLFDTQERAITYAKALVRSQGGSIRVHGVKGKMRKS
jgi:hypothetical protein